MATGPIETHLHRSFNWENAAPGPREGPRGRSANCGNGLFAQCVRLRSEINPLQLALISRKNQFGLKRITYLVLSRTGSPVRGDILVIFAVATSRKEFGVAQECISYFFPDTSRAYKDKGALRSKMSSSFRSS